MDIGVIVRSSGPSDTTKGPRDTRQVCGTWGQWYVTHDPLRGYPLIYERPSSLETESLGLGSGLV